MIKIQIKKFLIFFYYLLNQVVSYFFEFLFFLLIFYLLNNKYTAHSLSKLIACLISFILHRKFTFSSKNDLKKEFFKYISFLPVNLIIGNFLIFFIGTTVSDVNIQKILADFIGFIITFIFYKYYVYK